MAKKKKTKRPHFRNAAPRAPRVGKTEDETPLKRLAYTAAGAAGTALAGSFLAHEGWAPKTIATNPQLNIVMEWSPGQIRSAGFDVPAFLGELEGMGLRPFMIRKRGPSPVSFGEVLNLPYEAGLLLKRP